MKKIVVLSADTKLLKDTGHWLNELHGETVVETVSELSEFTERFCQPPKKEEAEQTPIEVSGSVDPNDMLAKALATPAPSAQSDALDLDHLGTLSERHAMVRMIVVDLESIDTDPIPWIGETRKAMIEHGYADANLPLRFMLVGYPDEKFSIDRYRHPSVDDLMLKPVDKAVFLQKTELFLSDDSSVRPSFLFKQKTNQTIEMGKDTFIESLAELGFTIRNPAPLTAGVFAKVYSPVFGVGDKAAVIGRVYSAERHPTEAGAYLCYLTFHGITSEQLANVRKLIRQDKSSATRKPAPQFEAPMKTVVVVDINSDTREVIRDSLTSNFMNVNVITFPSYNAFLNYCDARKPSNGMRAPAEMVAGESSEPVAAAEKTLAGDKKITFTVDVTNGELISMDPSPRSSVLVLGEEAGDLRERPSLWMDIFDAENKQVIDEFLVYLQSGQSASILVHGETKEIGRVNLKITGRLERVADGDGITTASLKLEELNDEEWSNELAPPADDSDMQTIDALYIDGSFLGENPEASLEGLMQLLRRANMIQTREALTVSILGDERSKLKPADYRLKLVQDFVYKPVDRKMLIAKAAIHMRGLVPQTDSVDLHFRRAGKPGRVTKEVVMDELSEFGLQISNPTPLREDTFLRFFSPIFLDTTGNGVLGRCLYSARNESDGLYNCFFSFFGATDAQLKHIRNWIRGDYASRKEKAGG